MHLSDVVWMSVAESGSPSGVFVLGTEKPGCGAAVLPSAEPEAVGGATAAEGVVASDPLTRIPVDARKIAASKTNSMVFYPPS